MPRISEWHTRVGRLDDFLYRHFFFFFFFSLFFFGYKIACVPEKCQQLTIWIRNRSGRALNPCCCRANYIWLELMKKWRKLSLKSHEFRLYRSIVKNYSFRYHTSKTALHSVVSNFTIGLGPRMNQLNAFWSHMHLNIVSFD